MYEDNIFESHEFEAKADFEMDWEDLLEELRDYEIPEERLSELAAQDGGFPFLELNFLSKRMFIDDVLVSRAITLQMPGIIAAFEKISENFSDVDHLAFSMDDKRAHIFYADMDETIDHMLTTCGRIANRSGKQSGIGEVFYDTFLDRVEHALFELIFLVNKPTDELAFVSGVAMQRLDSIRAGEMELGELTLDEINRLMLNFPELLNLDWLFK